MAVLCRPSIFASPRLAVIDMSRIASTRPQAPARPGRRARRARLDRVDEHRRDTIRETGAHGLQVCRLLAIQLAKNDTKPLIFLLKLF